MEKSSMPKFLHCWPSNPPFYEFSSEPLSIAVTRMFKYSSNFTAEMLFKTLSARRAGDFDQGSWDKSAKLVREWWRDADCRGMPIIRNGSGMGNVNRISPFQIAGLLATSGNKKPISLIILAALPSAGFDGTLKSRFVKSRLRGRVRAKTGTLNSEGINTLAGYLTTRRRNLCLFAIFCHSSGRRAMGRLDDTGRSFGKGGGDD